MKKDEFECKIIKTDTERKERFVLISRENFDEIKNHDKFISAADNWYIDNVVNEGELGFIIQSEGWKLRLIADWHKAES